MNTIKFGTVILSLVVVSSVHGANILALFPLPGKSHYVMFERLLVSMAEKGHQVDVVTHFPTKEAVPDSFNQLSIKGSLPIFVNNISVEQFQSLSHYSMVVFQTKICGIDACRSVFNTKVLQDLKTSKKRYDLVVTEIFGSDCMLAFGHYYRAPTVSLISSVALPWSNDRIGNPDNPSYIPSYFAYYTSTMTLWQRLQNTVNLLKSKFLYKYLQNEGTNEVIKEFFGEGIPDVEDLAYNTSLIIANSHFSTNIARPTVPNFIEVGGLHIKEPKPLTKHFENLLRPDPKYKGVIYLSMGSMVMTETFPVRRIQGMFDAFGELPFKVLWKADRDRFPKNLKFAENIHFEKWMPQMEILCHPNVKLFVSHGGLMGSQEALYCGVPTLGIPLFADQESNIRNSELLGLSIKVGYDEISKDTILSAARNLLEDPRYKQQAEIASRRFKDRPMSPLDTAIFWMEYVIRHKGAPYMRSRAADLAWYQYYLIDVSIILLIIICGTIYGINVLTKIMLRLVSSNTRRTKSD